jgi:prepilin-type N-terminal cleavage/methylation domain-containing protein
MKGVTLMELLISMAIIAIIGSMILSYANNGATIQEMNQAGGSICKSGYLWNVDTQRNQRQVLNENGGGVPCK